MAQGFALPQPTKKTSHSLHQNQVTEIEDLQTSLLSYCEDIPDPRVQRTRKHLLKDILVIAILAVRELHEKRIPVNMKDLQCQKELFSNNRGAFKNTTRAESPRFSKRCLH